MLLPSWVNTDFITEPLNHYITEPVNNYIEYLQQDIFKINETCMRTENFVLVDDACIRLIGAITSLQDIDSWLGSDASAHLKLPAESKQIFREFYRYPYEMSLSKLEKYKEMLSKFCTMKTAGYTAEEYRNVYFTTAEGENRRLTFSCKIDDLDYMLNELKEMSFSVKVMKEYFTGNNAVFLKKMYRYGVNLPVDDYNDILQHLDTIEKYLDILQGYNKLIIKENESDEVRHFYEDAAKKHIVGGLIIFTYKLVFMR